jgi:competence protein ComGC
MMKREFTQREKVLLLFLVVILLLTGYLKLFLAPVEKQYAEAQTKYADAQDSLTQEEAKLSSMKKMEAALKKLEEDGASSDITIPAYDNSDNVMVQLDAILGSAVNYQVTFSDVVYGTNLVSRPVKLTFTAKNYAAAKAILTSLYECRYRCTLSDITVSSGSDNGNVRTQSVSVSLTATFYEKFNKAAQKDQAASAATDQTATTVSN